MGAGQRSQPRDGLGKKKNVSLGCISAFLLGRFSRSGPEYPRCLPSDNECSVVRRSSSWFGKHANPDTDLMMAAARCAAHAAVAVISILISYDTCEALQDQVLSTKLVAALQDHMCISIRASACCNSGSVIGRPRPLAKKRLVCQNLLVQFSAGDRPIVDDWETPLILPRRWRRSRCLVLSIVNLLDER